MQHRVTHTEQDSIQPTQKADNPMPTAKNAVAEPEPCFYCTARDMTDACNTNSIVEAEVLFAAAMTAEEARFQLMRYFGYSEDSFTEARIATHMRHPRIEEICRRVCDNHLRVCEWCRDGYVIPDNGLDIDANIQYTNMEYVHSDRLCRGCADDAYTCHRCGDITSCDDARSVSGYTWCAICCDDHASWCELCENYYRLGRHACPNETRSTGRGTCVQSYGYKPSPEFKWIEQVDGDLSNGGRAMRNTPFMGFELEIELCGSMVDVDALEVCEEAFGDIAYYKHDGSLDNGFEIVTHPMTLAAHQELIDWDFCERLRNGGVLSWNSGTCGLHVHISRSSFRSLTHMALFQFLILHNEQQFSMLAGRAGSDWARFGDVSQTVIKEMKGKAYRGRYEAVNVTNSSTLEVRIFRGSLKKERVLMALELVNACWAYTKNMGSNAYINGACDWSSFAAWCKDKEEYEELNGYIKALPAALQE
jgi:hypothetical protein